MTASDLSWRPNWVATCFAGARVREADGGDPGRQDREAELTMLGVIAQCETGCSLDALKDLVLARLVLIGYQSLIVMAWLEERSEAAWRMYHDQKVEVPSG